MSSWSCPHSVNDVCRKVAGAYCRPGMRGCILFGKVSFAEGEAPYPVWPGGAGAADLGRAGAAEAADPRAPDRRG